MTERQRYLHKILRRWRKTLREVLISEPTAAEVKTSAKLNRLMSGMPPRLYRRNYRTLPRRGRA